MRSLKPDKDILVKKIKIKSHNRTIPALVLSPKGGATNAPGVLWIHGGGYISGMKEMVHMSRAVDLVKKYGAVVISPGYRLAFLAPYPAAICDCYDALLYLKDHCNALGINRNQIMVGGESAGGGLCAALCMMARDKGEVHIAYQMPLYPMIDNWDTESSRDNHGRVWNTWKNHFGWRLYLRKDAKKRCPPTPLLPDRRITPISHLHIPLWATENLFIRRRLRLSITCKKAVFLQRSMSILRICTRLT